MSQTCLPDALWSDPDYIELADDSPRLWMLASKIMRLWALFPDRVSTWSPSKWASNVSKGRLKQFEKDVATFRAKGYMEPDAIRFHVQKAPCESVAIAAPVEAHAPRPRYRSDEKRKSQSNGHSATAPQELRTDSTAEPSDTPQPLRNDSADAPQETAQPSRVRACPDPDPDSGTDSLYKKSGYPDPDPDPDGSLLRGSLRMQPPKTLAERLSELGMSKKRAEERIQEFGAQKCEDALWGLRCQAEYPADPAGWAVNFLVKKHVLSASAKALREAQKQEALAMLSTVEGGSKRSQEAAPTRPGPAAMQPITETIKTLHASQLRPPPGTDPPKDVLAAARDAVRRLG